MAEQFRITSQVLEDKLNSLLPSQGGMGAGVDLSASTMVVPIVDLTESAEGSVLRQDLQTALSQNSITSFNVTATTTTIINTTGYWRVFSTANMNNSAGNIYYNFTLTDGVTAKTIIQPLRYSTTPTNVYNEDHDFIVKLAAGDSLTVFSSNSNCTVSGCTRQLATLDGTLVNP